MVSVELEEKEFVQYMSAHNGQLIASPVNRCNRSGRTEEEIARDAPQDCFAFQTLRLFEGSMWHDGQVLLVESHPFDETGWTYINGQVFTLAQMLCAPEVDWSAINQMVDNQHEHMVKTRSGMWLPYMSYDKVITLK